MRNEPAIKKQPLACDAPTDAALRRFIGYRLKRAYNTIRSDMLHQMEPLGLRITTFSTLLLIVDQPGLRQSALANLLDIKRSNMVAIIDDLELKGWIKRKAAPEDRRAFALYATVSGERSCEKAVALAGEQDEKLMSCLSDGEQLTLINLLEKIESSKRSD